MYKKKWLEVVAWIFLSKWQVCCKPEVHLPPANVHADPLISLYRWQERGVARAQSFSIGRKSLCARDTVLCLMVWLHWRRQLLVMPLGGKYHLETLLATRESQRISLMGGGVGCRILSILHCSTFLLLSVPLCPHLCPLPTTSYLSQPPSSRQLHQEPYHRLPAWKIS